MDVSFLFQVLIMINIILSFTVVFLERKNPTSTWAWLFLLTFIPVGGFILYLIFGHKISHKKIFIWDNKSRLGVKKAAYQQLKLLKEEALPIHSDFHQHKDFFYMHLRNNDALFTQKNEVKIFNDGKEKFAALINDIKEAKHHVHLVYYIVRSDTLGRKVAEALIERANAGLEVRFLYDAMGTRDLSKDFLKSLHDAGVHVESFFPSVIPKLNFKLNYRNHRKLAIIDGRIGYIGGFNIGDEYLGKSKKFGYWRDTHLRIDGEAVSNMQTRFILDWNQAAKDRILQYDSVYYQAEPKGEEGIQIVSSGPDNDWEQIKYGYIKMIMEAKRYVYIQTPYFIPDESLADAVRIAALSGIDVRIMIPDKPDHPFVYWATYSYVGDMLKAGAKIDIYKNGFLHAKTIVVDGKLSSVGTANIDVRSFRLNFEVNAFIYSKKVASQLEKAYKDDMTLCQTLTIDDYQMRSTWIRFKESIARLISPIL